MNGGVEEQGVHPLTSDFSKSGKEPRMQTDYLLQPCPVRFDKLNHACVVSVAHLDESRSALHRSHLGDSCPMVKNKTCSAMSLRRLFLIAAIKGSSAGEEYQYFLLGLTHPCLHLMLQSFTLMTTSSIGPELYLLQAKRICYLRLQSRKR